MEQAERRIRTTAFKPSLSPEESTLLAQKVGVKSCNDFRDLAIRTRSQTVLRLLLRHPNWRVRRNVFHNRSVSDETKRLIRVDERPGARKRYELLYGRLLKSK